jgi:hypothetical protein
MPVLQSAVRGRVSSVNRAIQLGSEEHGDAR